MYVSIELVRNMSNVEDQEVMHDYIVCLDADGSFWATKQDQPKYSNIDDVPFMEAKPWMVQRFHRLLGKGKAHVNDQLMDDRIRDLATVSIEESRWTDLDYFGTAKSIRDEVMPNAFGGEYEDVEFSL